MGFAARLPRLRPTSGELLHLDLMRFIAAAGIVFHHSHEFFVPAAKSPFLVREQTAGLALFVDLFFVISGFVIAYIYHGRTNSLAGYFTFLQRRVGRLVPLHWLTLLISIAVWVMLVRLHYSERDTPTFAFPCIAETALLLHSFLSCGRPFNGITWSISAEMVMYVGFPFAALMGARHAYLLLVFGVGLLVAAVMAAMSQQGGDFFSTSWVELSPVLRALPSFVIGAALFYNRKTVARLPQPAWLLAIATASLIAAMMAGVSQLVTLLIVYIVAMAAIAADLKGPPTALVRRCAPLGQLTYSIYMWHLLIILLSMYVMGDEFLHRSILGTTVIVIACYACIFILSYLSFFFIETPARRWIDGITLFKPAVSGAMPL